ncbi:hypothetical protein RhiirC2_761649 [Rhizophagus irregularis]|uniref:Uncharacterized protein n=1 Tax=Rhizophagus irregularis TaxID=588596 RepID=A0A2N1MG07_9GLOM|nr:hypothetical protein RhiirC2_761649 [Rhizophagus irregularis]
MLTVRSQCLGYVNTTVRRGGGSEETNYTYFHTSFEHNSNKEAIEEFDANNRKMATRLAKKDKMKSVNMEKVVERPQKVKKSREKSNSIIVFLGVSFFFKIVFVCGFC